MSFVVITTDKLHTRPVWVFIFYRNEIRSSTENLIDLVYLEALVLKVSDCGLYCQHPNVFAPILTQSVTFRKTSADI